MIQILCELTNSIKYLQNGTLLDSPKDGRLPEVVSG
jgi:hypothetical protein